MPDSPGKSVMAGMPGMTGIPGAGPALVYAFSIRIISEAAAPTANEKRQRTEQIKLSAISYQQLSCVMRGAVVPWCMEPMELNDSMSNELNARNER